MLAPVVFRLPGVGEFAPLQVAPWADEPGAEALPGILRRLRGEWPCVPFGRTDRPPALPPGWTVRTPDDDFGHGYAAHHDWHWLTPEGDSFSLRLAIEPPQGPVRRLERRISARPDAPELEIELRIEVREPCLLPVALHPTLRLDAGRVVLRIAHDGAALSYPVPAEPGISRLRPDGAFALDAAPLEGGGTLDLTRFPLPFDTEELLQATQVRGPVELDFLDAGATLAIDWDRHLLPDVMLWVSHRGRRAPPWSGRHWALGIEPVNGPFDLGRVASPPASHPAAAHAGLALHPQWPCVLRSALRARSLAEPVSG